MSVLTNKHLFQNCREGEVLHLRFPLYAEVDELQSGYYVLREVLSFRDDAGVSFVVMSQAGEDEDGQMVTDGGTHILPRHLLEHFVGIGIRAREPFITEH